MSKRLLLVLTALVMVLGVGAIGCAAEDVAPAPPEEEEEAPAEEEEAPAAPAAEVIRWVGQAALPSGMPVHESLVILSERITAASKGQLVWDAKPAGAVVPATEEYKGVSSGVLDFCFGGGSYMAGDIRFGTLISQRCGGMPPLPHLIWHRQEGSALANKWYPDYGFNITDIAGAGAHGLPEGWIHLDKELTGPEDLDGLKMRASGDGGEVLRRMGVGAVFMPLGEVFEAMNRGLIDAFECSNPAFDWSMGLQEVGKYYYLSPTRAPTEVYQLLINADNWNELDDDLKVIVEDCGRAEAMSYFTRLNAANATAIQAFKDYGVIVELLPASIDEAFLVVAAEYMDELGAEDPAMAEMLASHTAFWDTWKSLYGG